MSLKRLLVTSLLGLPLSTTPAQSGRPGDDLLASDPGDSSS